MSDYRESAHERALEKQRERATRPDNADEILRAVVEYRAACDAVGPAWNAFVPLAVTMPERTERREKRHVYMLASERVRIARKALIEACLDGRSEVPR